MTEKEMKERCYIWWHKGRDEPKVWTLYDFIRLWKYLHRPRKGEDIDKKLKETNARINKRWKMILGKEEEK